jgi:hypothetical protein
MRRLKPVVGGALAVVIVLQSSWSGGASADAQPRTHDVEVRKVHLDRERGADVRLVVSYRHDTEHVRFRILGHGAEEGIRWRWTLRVTTGSSAAGASGTEVKAHSYWSSGVVVASDTRRHVARARVEGPWGESCSGVNRARPHGG